jgi:hypothetical protein
MIAKVKPKSCQDRCGAAERLGEDLHRPLGAHPGHTALRMHAERPQPAHRAGLAGADARAPCLQARARLHAVGSLVGSLVQLQRVSLPGLLVTAGQAPRSGDAAGGGALLDACALAGARDLQVRAPAHQLFGLCGCQSNCMLGLGCHCGPGPARRHVLHDPATRHQLSPT